MLLAAALLLPVGLAGQTAPTPGAQASRAPMPAEAQAQLAQLQGALKSAAAARDARGAGKILNQIGDLWLRVGNPDNAQQAYTNAVAAARQAVDAVEGVAALNGLGPQEA